MWRSRHQHKLQAPTGTRNGRGAPDPRSTSWHDPIEPTEIKLSFFTTWPEGQRKNGGPGAGNGSLQGPARTTAIREGLYSDGRKEGLARCAGTARSQTLVRAERTRSLPGRFLVHPLTLIIKVGVDYQRKILKERHGY